MAVLQPLDNDFVKNLEFPSGDVAFHRTCVDQLKQARSSIFDQICREKFVPHYTDIRFDYLLAKRSITKEKLATWLETVCCVLDQYAIPWLEKTALFPEELGKLKDEKISDQETIINLQNKVIEKQEESLKSVQSAVQTTVETEMKSYASAVSKSCSEAFAPKRIQTVVRKIAVKEETMKNVIVYGVSETEGEDVRSKVEHVLAEACCPRLFQIGVTKRGCCETHQVHCWIFRSCCPGYQKSPKSAHYRRVQIGLHQSGPNY